MKIKHILVSAICSFAVVTSCNPSANHDLKSIEVTMSRTAFIPGETISYSNFFVTGIRKDNDKVLLNDFKIKEFGKEKEYTFTSDDAPNKTFNISYNKFSKPITVVVSTVPVESVSIDESYVVLGETVTKAQLHANVYPSYASNPKLKWKSSDENIANVDENGLVTIPKNPIYNSCTITATSVENEKLTAQSFVINVSDLKPVESVKINDHRSSMKAGETQTLTATVKPNDATYPDIYWESSNKEVANVDETTGLVTALNEGKTTIKAISYVGGITDSFELAVYEGRISVEDVKLSSHAIDFAIPGGSQKLTATVLPSKATVKTVKWSSNNEQVATVDQNGIVTSHKLGEAIIKVTTDDGAKTDECKVVVGKIIPVESIKTSPEFIHFVKGESPASIKIMTEISPNDATDKRVEFFSWDDNIATVDSEGNVTPLEPGKETVIVVRSVSNPNIYCSVNVTINPDFVVPLKSLILSETDLLLHLGEEKKINVTRDPGTAIDKLSVQVTDTEKLVDATIDENDVITIKDLSTGKSGSNTIEVSSLTNPSIKATCTVFYINKKIFRFTNDYRNVDKTDSPIQLTTDYNEGGSVRFESFNEEVASIDGSQLSIKNYGTCVVKASVDNYLDAYAVFDVADFSKIKIINNEVIDNNSYSVINGVDLHLPNYFYNREDEMTYPVTAIANNAFTGSMVRRVFLGKNMIKIGANAFANCVDLRGVTINEELTNILDNAFANCKALKELAINSPIIAGFEDNDSHLYDNPSFIQLSKKAKEGIGIHAYIKKLNFVESKTSEDSTVIEKYTGADVYKFSDSQYGGLRLDNPSGDYPAITHIPNYVKRGDNYLPVVETADFSNEFFEDVYFPSTIKHLGKIWKCTNDKIKLKKIDIGDCVNIENKSLIDDQFSHNKYLEQIVLPQNLIKLGKYAFKQDTNLKIDITDANHTLPDTIEEICGECFCECDNLANSFRFPKSLKTIGYRAFYAIKGFNNTLEFNDSLIEIGKEAFRYCDNLRTIILPVSLKRMNSWAFYGCHKLDNVVYKGTKAQFNKIDGEAMFQETSVHKIHCTDGDIDW